MEALEAFVQHPGIQEQHSLWLSDLFATVFATAFEPQEGFELTTFEEQAGLLLTVFAVAFEEQAGFVSATFLQSAGLQFFNSAVEQFFALSPQKILHHSGEQQGGVWASTWVKVNVNARVNTIAKNLILSNFVFE